MGKGSAVPSDLPVTTSETERDTDASGTGANAGSSNTRTILAVDDDPIILMNTAALLEDLGYRVVEADGGKDALDCLNRHPEIDLLITDHAMPGMSGSELIDAARLIRPELPIILATGYAAEAVTQAIGLTWLAKPYSFADLEAAVRRSEA